MCMNEWIHIAHKRAHAEVLAHFQKQNHARCELAIVNKNKIWSTDCSVVVDLVQAMQVWTVDTTSQ